MVDHLSVNAISKQCNDMFKVSYQCSNLWCWESLMWCLLGSAFFSFSVGLLLLLTSCSCQWDSTLTAFMKALWYKHFWSWINCRALMLMYIWMILYYYFKPHVVTWLFYCTHEMEFPSNMCWSLSNCACCMMHSSPQPHNHTQTTCTQMLCTYTVTLMNVKCETFVKCETILLLWVFFYFMLDFSQMHQTQKYTEWLLPFRIKRTSNILVMADIDAEENQLLITERSRAMKCGAKHMRSADFVILHVSWKQQSGRSSRAGRTHGRTRQGLARCS